VPVRQWVLSLPYRLRYRLEWDRTLARMVLTAYVRVLLVFNVRYPRGLGFASVTFGLEPFSTHARGNPPGDDTRPA